jgi:anti-anti-sigma factor
MPPQSPPSFKILCPSHTLDAEQGKILYREIMDLLDGGIKVILIDCQRITFVDSSGLGVLVRILKATEQEHARLALCSLNDGFQMLLAMTQMEDVFEIYASQVHFRLVLGIS